MTRVHLFRFIPLMLGIGLLAGLAGCGNSGGKADVTGTIKLRGQPPKFNGLEILFLGEDGVQASGAINEDGTYEAKSVPTGEVKISFAYITPDAAKEGAEFKAGGGSRLQKPGGKKVTAPQPKLTGKEPTTSPIPQDLREAHTSKLTFKVESGKPNVFDYDIQGAAAPGGAPAPAPKQ